MLPNCLIDDKKAARSYFNEVRQKFIDWNDIASDDERFDLYLKEIEELRKSRFASYDKRAEKLIETE